MTLKKTMDKARDVLKDNPELLGKLENIAAGGGVTSLGSADRRSLLEKREQARQKAKNTL